MKVLRREQFGTQTQYDIQVEPDMIYSDRQLLDFVHEDSTFGYMLHRKQDVYILIVNND